MPVPDFIDEGWVRLAMLALAIAIPLAIGVAAIYVTGPGARPKGAALAVGCCAATRSRWSWRSRSSSWRASHSPASSERHEALGVAHVPVIVKPGGYDQVLEAWSGCSTTRGWTSGSASSGHRVAPAEAPRPVAGRSLGGLVPDRLMLLVGSELEVLVYPSDVSISGTKGATARARAAIATTLDATRPPT